MVFEQNTNLVFMHARICMYFNGYLNGVKSAGNNYFKRKVFASLKCVKIH